MPTPLQSLVATGTKLWLDSVDPDEVKRNLEFGATGATSNPIIISDLLKTGRFDSHIGNLLKEGLNDEDIAWRMTDLLVKQAQESFLPIWEKTHCDDGWVSFELDPLLEDKDCTLTIEEKAKRYIELAKKWSAGHKNRMIKVPATPGGLAAVEEMAAAGITLNITLIFSERQYLAAQQAAWKGAQRRPGGLDTFKSVYSIFVSRLDVYTLNQVKELTVGQGYVGIVNAKKLWKLNNDFWATKGLKLKQEIIFASTGAKLKGDVPWKYVEAFAGSDIETNPPATNKDVQEQFKGTFTRMVDQMPSADIVADIEKHVDMKKLEETLMSEGLSKFAEPHKQLLALIAEKRKALA